MQQGIFPLTVYVLQAADEVCSHERTFIARQGESEDGSYRNMFTRKLFGTEEGKLHETAASLKDKSILKELYID